MREVGGKINWARLSQTPRGRLAAIEISGSDSGNILNEDVAEYT
jgi:hypothetical protein